MTKEQVLKHIRFTLQSVVECIEAVEDVVPQETRQGVNTLFEEQILALKIACALVEAAPADSPLFVSP